jgi:cyanate permease
MTGCTPVATAENNDPRGSRVEVPPPRRVNHALFFVRVAGTTPRLVVQALFPQIMAAGAFGPRTAGLIMMGQTAVAIASILAFPLIRQAASLRAIILAGGIMCAIGLAAIAFNPTVFTIAFAFCAIGGLGWTLFSLRGPQEIVNVLPAQQWAGSMSAVTRGPLVSSLLVPALSLWLLVGTKWQWVVGGAACAVLVVAVYGFRVLPVVEKACGHKPPVLREVRNTGMGIPAVAMFFSGYIAGMFHTHLIILASSVGRSPSELALWSVAFGVSTVVAVSAWAAALKRNLLVRCTTVVAVVAAVIGAVTASAPATSWSLCGAVLWSVLSVGLYIEAMHAVSEKAESTTRLTGLLVILHMLAASLGALLTGVLAEARGSYTTAFLVLAVLSSTFVLIRIGTAFAGGRRLGRDQVGG